MDYSKKIIMATVQKVKIRSKRFPVGNVPVTLNDNGHAKGLKLGRKLTAEECKVILRSVFGCSIYGYEDFESAAAFNDYNNHIAKDVNEWLTGNSHSMAFVEKYSGSFDEESVGPFCIIPIISYLRSKEIIW